MYRLFFEGPVIFFYRLGGGVEDFWENTWLERRKIVRHNLGVLSNRRRQRRETTAD